MTEAGLKLVKRLVRSGLKSQKVRDRIAVVVREKRAEAAETMRGADAAEIESVAATEARTQLMNEAFSELRYRSVLMIMKNDMPKVPLRTPTLDLPLDISSKRPTLPHMTPDPTVKKALVATQERPDTPERREVTDSDLEAANVQVANDPPRRGGSRLNQLYNWWHKSQEDSAGEAEKERGLTTLREPGSGLNNEDAMQVEAMSPLQVRFLVSNRLKEATELLRSEGPASQPIRALRLCRQAVAIMQRSHGSGHPLLLPVLNVYAFACLHNKAVPQCELAVRILTKMFERLSLSGHTGLFSPLDPLCYDPARERAVLLSTMMQLSSLKGDFEDAVKHGKEALKLFELVTVEEDETVIAAREGVSLNLGINLSILGRTEEADAVFKRSLLDMAARYSPTSALLAPHLQMMSLYALKMKNFDEAQTLAATAYKNLYDSYGFDHPRTMYSMRQVAETCLHTKQYKVAARWLVVLNRMYVEHLTKHGTALAPLEHARALHLLCLSNLGLNRGEAAMQIAIHSLRLHDKLLPPNSIHLREPLLAWCTAYRVVGGYGKKNGALYAIQVLERFLGVLNANTPKKVGEPWGEAHQSWFCDRWFVLLHFALFHLWVGDYARAQAALHALKQLQGEVPYQDMRVWLPDVERVYRANGMTHAWPDQLEGGDFQSFVFILLLICTAEQIYQAYQETFGESKPADAVQVQNEQGGA